MIPKMYYRLIKKGEKTIEDVPSRWEADVQALLDVDVLEEGEDHV